MSSEQTQILIVGDRDGRPTHVATETSLRDAAREAGHDVAVEWIGTDVVLARQAAALADAGGLFIAPGSPYREPEGMVFAIRWARENDVPTLATCGGFQYVIVELMRNVAGAARATHSELGESRDAVVVPLADSLVDRVCSVRFEPGSSQANPSRATETDERFRCSFGVAAHAVEELHAKGVLLAAWVDRELAAIELQGHRFFVGTLFQPQLSSTPEKPHPLIAAFVSAATATQA